jgi:hypothetical protein
LSPVAFFAVLSLARLLLFESLLAIEGFEVSFDIASFDIASFDIASFDIASFDMLSCAWTAVVALIRHAEITATTSLFISILQNGSSGRHGRVPFFRPSRRVGCSRTGRGGPTLRKPAHVLSKRSRCQSVPSRQALRSACGLEYLSA